MATQFPGFQDAHQKFIKAQHMFFVGTAAQDGRVNISPKGMDSLRVMNANRIVWRNLTGSGNETAGHLQSVNRMTLMWCGFETQPMILRAYGAARCLHPRDADFEKLNALFPASPGARQIYDLTVDLVQTSCGYAVPLFDYKKDRDILRNWAEAKGPAAIQTYWQERNQQTIDGFPTGISDR